MSYSASFSYTPDAMVAAHGNEMPGGGGLLPNLRLHVNLPRGGHKLHPRPFPPVAPR